MGRGKKKREVDCGGGELLSFSQLVVLGCVTSGGVARNNKKILLTGLWCPGYYILVSSQEKYGNSRDCVTYLSKMRCFLRTELGECGFNVWVKSKKGQNYAVPKLQGLPFFYLTGFLRGSD